MGLKGPEHRCGDFESHDSRACSEEILGKDAPGLYSAMQEDGPSDLSSPPHVSTIV